MLWFPLCFIIGLILGGFVNFMWYDLRDLWRNPRENWQNSPAKFILTNLSCGYAILNAIAHMMLAVIIAGHALSNNDINDPTWIQLNWLGGAIAALIGARIVTLDHVDYENGPITRACEWIDDKVDAWRERSQKV